MSRPSTEVRHRPLETVLPVIVIGVVILAAAVVWTSVALSAAVEGTQPAGQPIGLLLALMLGHRSWPGWVATATAIGWLVVLAVIGGLVARRLWRRPRSRVDGAVKHLAGHRELGHLTPANAAVKANELRSGGAGTDPAGHGVLIGRTLGPRRALLRQSFEDVSVDIWGPRRGKTTTRAIPAVLEAPGSVLATSNKSDLFDATWLGRLRKGPVWVFDPQYVVLDPDAQVRHCWFNPLGEVRSITDAEALVGIFRAAETTADMKSDAFFKIAADQLLACLFLAAARSGKDLLQVYQWLLRPRDEEPVDLLRQHVPEDQISPGRLMSVITAPDKQRAGVYGEASNLMRSITDPSRAAWVTPGTGPEFDPVSFVTSGNSTLYLLSEEGPGSAAALVAAIVKAIADAGKKHARRMPNKRLDPPVIAVLDETANVCRLPELPNYYSHFGSRGFVIQVYLQSYHQGVACWGEKGMSIMWDASTVNVYGGGVSDTRFLDQVSQLAGEHEVLQYSRSHGSKNHRTVSESRTRERTLTVADLGSLDDWRCVLLAAKARPTIYEAVPWWETPLAAQIRESIATPVDQAVLLASVDQLPRPAVRRFLEASE